jgi:hypothetical protein
MRTRFSRSNPSVSVGMRSKRKVMRSALSGTRYRPVLCRASFAITHYIGENG